MTLRTDEELDAALTMLAGREGISKQEVLRKAVLRWSEETEHRTVVADSSRRMIDEWSDVLDRLGSV